MRRAFFGALAALVLGCGTPSPRPPEARPPVGVLHAPSETEADFSVDHRITIRWEGGEQSFRAVLEKRGDVLTVVGLGPHGGRGFVLTLRGTEVGFESHLPEPLPFPPEHILMTIQRTWLGLPIEALPDGEHTSVRDGEREVQTWSGGLLLLRRFEREDGEPAGTFVVDYEGGLSPAPGGTTPARITISDGWMRFELVLDGITRQALL